MCHFISCGTCRTFWLHLELPWPLDIYIMHHQTGPLGASLLVRLRLQSFTGRRFEKNENPQSRHTSLFSPKLNSAFSHSFILWNVDFFSWYTWDSSEIRRKSDLGSLSLSSPLTRSKLVSSKPEVGGARAEITRVYKVSSYSLMMISFVPILIPEWTKKT